jgi:hypothetical protein
MDTSQVCKWPDWWWARNSRTQDISYDYLLIKSKHSCNVKNTHANFQMIYEQEQEKDMDFLSMMTLGKS